MGRRVGRKAAAWGAVCGTLPDLDVLIPYAGPVADFTYHRSFSHSLLVLIAITPLLGGVIDKLQPARHRNYRGWCVLVGLSLITHALLDCFTIYGTQIFWPLSDWPIALGSVFIIDPLYTALLATGLLAAIFFGGDPRKSVRFNAIGLSLSTLYLAWSLAAKMHVQSVAEHTLAQQTQAYERIETLAAPLNTLLWRVVVMDQQSYRVGWYSLLDPAPKISFTRYESGTHWLSGLETHWPVRRLQWFTKGFYRVEREQSEILMTDIRMGVEGYYVFRFKVGEVTEGQARATPDESRRQLRKLDGIQTVFARILDPQVILD